jgi:hypothetical protein
LFTGAALRHLRGVQSGAGTVSLFMVIFGCFLVIFGNLTACFVYRFLGDAEGGTWTFADSLRAETRKKEEAA